MDSTTVRDTFEISELDALARHGWKLEYIMRVSELPWLRDLQPEVVVVLSKENSDDTYPFTVEQVRSFLNSMRG